MDQIIQVFLSQGLTGAVAAGLLYGYILKEREAKEGVRALMDEKDRRREDGVAFGNAMATAIRTLGEQGERLEAALKR